MRSRMVGRVDNEADAVGVDLTATGVQSGDRLMQRTDGAVEPAADVRCVGPPRVCADRFHRDERRAARVERHLAWTERGRFFGRLRHGFTAPLPSHGRRMLDPRQ